MEYMLGENLFGAKICNGIDDEVYMICYLMDEEGFANPDQSYVVEVRGSEETLIGVFDYDLGSPVVYNQALHTIDFLGGLHIWQDGNWNVVRHTTDQKWYLTGLRIANGSLYAFGVNRALLKYTDSGWRRVVEEERGIALTDVVGKSSDTLLVSGAKGFVAEVAAGNISELILPTNTTVTSISVLENGVFVLTGWNALAMLGNGDELTEIDVGGRTMTIYNSVEWNGELFFSTTDNVAVLNDLELVSILDKDSKRLAATKSFLWNLGSNGLSRFDGENWQHLDVAIDVGR